MKPILNIENLTKVYGTLPNQTRALNGITFQVMPGEFLGIMGSSGPGKSTLLNCIATVIQPTGGSIQVEGDTLQSLKGKALAEYRGKKVGYLFQNFELLDNLTGRENILLPTSLHGVSEAESSQRLKQLADYLEITDVLDKFPSKMSGGQRQRVAAARALILHPQMILADEPTGALDSKNARSLMEKLSGLNRDEQATILMVTHDSNAASFCKRILFIQDGVIFRIWTPYDAPEKGYSVSSNDTKGRGRGINTADHKTFPTWEAAVEFCQQIMVGEVDLETMRAEFDAAEAEKERRAIRRAVAEAKEFRGHLERAGISYTTLLHLVALQEGMGGLAHNILLGYEHGEGWPDGT